MALTQNFESDFGTTHPNAYYRIIAIRMDHNTDIRAVDLEGNPLPAPIKRYSDIHADVAIWNDQTSYNNGAKPIGGFTHRMTYQPTQGNVLAELYTDMKVKLEFMATAKDA